MRSYKWWQVLLAKTYFGEHQNGRPVLFFVDDEIARRLHQTAEPGITDLCTTVAEAVDWSGEAFAKVADNVREWRTKGQYRSEPPPCLPVLAVLVLAATRMRSKGTRGQRAYYERLAELIKPAGWTLPDATDHLRRGSEEIPTLWRYLKEWLEERDGRNGICTFYATKWRGRIGYAQSQAIMCADDNQRLAPFFKKYRGRSGHELLELLRQHGPEKYHLSKTCQEALVSNDRDEIVAQLLEMLSRTGQNAPAPAGIRNLELRLAAMQDQRQRWVLSWKIPCRDGLQGGALKHAGGTLQLTAEEGRRYYRLSGDLPDIGVVLKSGFKADEKYVRINAARRTKPVILQQDPHGGYVETKHAEPFQPSLIVYSEALEKQARELLDRAGYEWEPGDPCNVPGWYVLDRIEFDDEGRPRRKKIRLTGGLKVRQDLGRHHYLAGGEPDLVPPSGTEVVKIDGRPVKTGGRPVLLRGLGLMPGRHTAECDGHSLTFHTHAPRMPERRAKGASRMPSPPGPPLAAVYSDGGFTRLASSAAAPPPVWWRTRQTGLTGTSLQAEVPESAVWLVSEAEDGFRVMLRRREPPAIRRFTQEMREFWIKVFFAKPCDDEHQRLWADYCEKALEFSMKSMKAHHE